MGDQEQLDLLRQGVAVWNSWRMANTSVAIDLSRANLGGADLREANLSGVDLRQADLRGGYLRQANLSGAVLRHANLSGAYLRQANLSGAVLRHANLTEANLTEANLHGANLQSANLQRAVLRHARLVETRLEQANLSGCAVYGISVWEVNLRGATQENLIITRPQQTTITVDNLEVAQFIYLLLNNENVRNVINTIGKKGVLILGRFTERKYVLDTIRTELRQRDYVPIVFDFERPTDRDFTETVLTLAGMCLFIIADITMPKSVPLELQATVPNYMIPLIPIIEEGGTPFSMFVDLWHKYREWVLDPLYYGSVLELVNVFDQAVIEPAKQRRDILETKKAETLITRHVKDYQ
jgi:uncharacterized protein YjbI with pentapeptide repeats